MSGSVLTAGLRVGMWEEPSRNAKKVAAGRFRCSRSQSLNYGASTAGPWRLCAWECCPHSRWLLGGAMVVGLVDRQERTLMITGGCNRLTRAVMAAVGTIDKQIER